MKTNLYLLLAGTLISSSVLAAETVVGTEAQKNLNIVIYNNNRALVKDMRLVPMSEGKNEIAFSGISGQIIPASVVLNGSNITFLENNFNFDVLSYESLLQKSVGETVTVQYMNPKTGILETNTAELLALNGNAPILRMNGKIDGSYPGRILFNRIPDNLRAKPTLVMSVNTPVAAEQNLTLNYLTGGLSWDANYVAQLSPDNQQMTLEGWVSLTNNSGVDYQNAHMQVVAGDIHTVWEPVVNKKMRRGIHEDGMYVGALSDAGMVEENVADYHMYTLPRKTDILNNQTKQVSLLDANGVGIQKTYTFDNQLQAYDELKNIKPQVRIVFKNAKENHLGIALPRGVVRLYQADQKGNLIFVGEDRISHVGNMEEVTLNMGTAFDISADSKLVKSKQGRRVVSPQKEKEYTDKTYELTFRNGTKTPVKVDIVENFGREWTMLAESQSSEKPTAQQAKWTISVPAEGTETLTYTVRVE